MSTKLASKDRVRVSLAHVHVTGSIIEASEKRAKVRLDDGRVLRLYVDRLDRWRVWSLRGSIVEKIIGKDDIR